MKQKRLLALSLVLVLFVSMFAMVPSAGAATGPVNLIYARSTTGGTSMSATGYVEVENLGYNKKVTIRFTTDNGATWRDIAATYLQPTWGNYEAWTFHTDTFGIGHGGNGAVTFAIKYEVNGQEYWDNNNGRNYTVKSGFGVTSEYAFGASGSATLGDVSRDGDKITGSIQLKNMGYEKDVKVRYSNNNWKTYEDVSAVYDYTLPNGNEIWKFEITSAETIELAISYTVAGTTYWDNNFGKNYTINFYG